MKIINFFSVTIFIIVFILTLANGQLSSLVDWTKPMGYCKKKFIGSTIRNKYISPNWDKYWNQATPQYLGKWTSVEQTKDQMDWNGLDIAWNYSRKNGYLFKGHTLVWGLQVPSWMATLSTAEQAFQVEEWIRLYCERYPDYQLIDVVNEPLHISPKFANAIGGAGSTGWDWVIWSYQKARQYCPNAKLLINEYDVLNNDVNLAKYLQIINLLKDRKLLDGIGEQAHNLERTPDTQILNNLNGLAASGLPIYIAELDLNITDNTQHLNRIKKIVPMFYEHTAVKGITFWGFLKGETWREGTWLYDPNVGTSSTNPAATCVIKNLKSNIPLTLGVWNDYTVAIPTAGKIRAVFANDGTSNSQTMAVDYAIIDGVKYEAENQPVNTGVWNGASCGGSYSEMLHCSGYIEFPSGSSNVIIRAKGVGKGAEQLTIQLVTCTNGSASAVGLPQERASLKWLKYQYFPKVQSVTTPKAFFRTTISSMMVSFDAGMSTDCDGSIVLYSWTFGDVTTGSGMKIDHTYLAAGTYTAQLTVFDNNGNSDIFAQTFTITKTTNLTASGSING